MTGQTITLKEVLAEMDSGRKFDISFITCDMRKDTGGELIEVTGAHKHNWLSSGDYRKQQSLQLVKKLVKDPRHYENSTRNIIMPGSQVRKIHIRLIRIFNGKIVL